MSRERPVALVLIFDTSASMEYKSGDLSRLDLAKQRGLELLDQLPEDCRVLILDSSDAGNWRGRSGLAEIAGDGPATDRDARDSTRTAHR